MKKFTLLIASLFITIGAMAQFETGKEYRIKVVDGDAAGEYVTIGDNFGHAYGYVHTMALDENNADQKFTFVSSNGNWKVKSVNEEYFAHTGVTGTGWNTWNLNKTTNESSATEVIFVSTGTENEYYLRANTSQYFKVGAIAEGGSSYKHVYYDAAESARTKFAVEEVEEVEQEARIVTSINTEKYYTLHCMAADHGTYIADNGTVISGRNAEGTFFVFEPAESENAYYIKSIKTNKYLNCEATANASVLTSDTPTAWTLGIGGKDNVANYVTFTLGNDLYLNNNGGTNGLKANYHSGGPATGNACSLWQLTEYDEVPAIVTYNYKVGERVIATVAHNVYTGDEYPALGSYYGVTFNSAKPEGQIEGDSEHDIDVTIALPFEYADSYENITHWYYLAIKPGEVDYLYHEAGQTNIPLTVATKPAAEAKYAWAFVGDPFDGYRIYNYAAGADMVLSSSTTMAGTNGGGTHPVMTALPVADGNNELWIATASTHGTNGFFLAQKGFANNRMNNRDDILAYWTGGADAGSTFYVERCIVPDGYYRIAYDNSGTEYYLQGVASTVKGCAFTTETDAKSIWYYGNSRLLSYTAGEYIKEVSDYRGLQGIGVDGGAVTIAASSRDASKYTIACTSYLHFNTSDDSNYFGDHCGSEGGHSNHDMILENVMSLPVTISEAGFATLYAPVALKVADGVVAYTVTLNGQWATLNKIESGVIPANTGVVLAGEVVDNEVTPATADTYDFVVTTTDATVTSALSGSAPATYYTETGTYYALAQVDGVVGFYKDQFNNSRFQNNSHKAYLYVADAAGIASYSFRFGEGTTGVEKVEIRNEKSEIYDLTGRRVEAITAPGIYIVGGKKVLVK